MNFGLKEEMGFEDHQLQSLLLTKPKLWIMSTSWTLQTIHVNSHVIWAFDQFFILMFQISQFWLIGLPTCTT